ncbi:uncharacterized protein TNIN_25341 [Trichonephila inaurata madagascariensis]|uniref:Pre-rRNA-processing protein RIX1 N-terminal domain-containing protein n=1 Tax=Trichonephila inaurata madagascariensis TaxID=2747483 RepID=A0A8X6YNA6_9ARAC|nr:uncharacterized protein TNIN_25341 [Trichonephila inaurata madagascariensis]
MEEIVASGDHVRELLLYENSKEGLVLMHTAMKQDSKLYIENWGPIIIGSLKCHDSYIPKKLVLKILNVIVENFSQESVYNDAFQRFIPEILPLLLNVDDETYRHCCHTLAVLMRCIPKIVGAHLDEIEKFMLKKLDSMCTKTIEAIAECFAALPTCQMHFKKTRAPFKDIWLDIYLKILNTIQLILNDILQMSGDDSECINAGTKKVFKIPIQDPEKCSILSRIRTFSTFCTCLAKMMSSETSLVEVPIEEVLLSIQRVFRVTNVLKLSDQDPNRGLLKMAFPLMLNAVFAVFEAIILNFTIIEQSSNIVMFIGKSLEGIHAASYNGTSTCQARSAVWKFCKIWLTQFGAKGSSQMVREKFLIQEVLKDIALDNTDGKQPELTNGIKSEVTVKDSKVLVCAEALKVLRIMILTGGCFMEKSCVDNISSTVIDIARELMLHLNLSKQFPFPYSDEKCRKRLYDVLLTCSIAGDPLQSKCIMKSVNIFRIALRDKSPKVSEVCHKGFKYCKLFLNPMKPPPDMIGFSNSNLFIRSVIPTNEVIKENWQNPCYTGRSSDVDMSNEEDQSQEEECNNADENVRLSHDYDNYRATSNVSQNLDDQNQDGEVDSSQINIRNVNSGQDEHKMVAMKTEKHVSEEREANVSTYHNTHENTMHTNQNCSDSESEGEEMEDETRVRQTNGFEYTEEEDGDHDEGGEEEADEEADDEDMSDGRRSTDHYDDRTVKRQRIMIEAEAEETEVNNSLLSAASTEGETEMETQVNNRHSPNSEETNAVRNINDEENQNDSDNANQNDSDNANQNDCEDANQNGSEDANQNDSEDANQNDSENAPISPSVNEICRVLFLEEALAS